MQGDGINSSVVISLLEAGSPQQITAPTAPIMMSYTQYYLFVFWFTALRKKSWDLWINNEQSQVEVATLSLLWLCAADCPLFQSGYLPGLEWKHLSQDQYLRGGTKTSVTKQYLKIKINILNIKICPWWTKCQHFKKRQDQ